MIKAVFFGFNPPFLTSSGQVLPTQTDERLIKNDLLQLLLTIPGERPFRPTFGSPLRQALFEPIDTLSLGNLKSGILRAIKLNEPRVTTTDLRIETDGENTLRVKLFAFLTISPNIQLQIDLKLPFMANG